ncbi:hypothetical protein HYY71_01265 [Candidatus Woesearchaeota archaeon]|nr:hypothetical protein [Candidatus Woesearchaeota archaeon]
MNNLAKNKVGKGLASLIAIIILLSSVLATSVFYQNNITANVIKEMSIDNNPSKISIKEINDIKELSQLNEGWYEIRNGFVFYLDTFNSYVPLYIKVRNFEQQNGLLAVDENGNVEFEPRANILREKEIVDEELNEKIKGSQNLETEPKVSSRLDDNSNTLLFKSFGNVVTGFGTFKYSGQKNFKGKNGVIVVSDGGSNNLYLFKEKEKSSWWYLSCGFLTCSDWTKIERGASSQMSGWFGYNQFERDIVSTIERMQNKDAKYVMDYIELYSKSNDVHVDADISYSTPVSPVAVAASASQPTSDQTEATTTPTRSNYVYTNPKTKGLELGTRQLYDGEVIFDKDGNRFMVLHYDQSGNIVSSFEGIPKIVPLNANYVPGTPLTEPQLRQNKFYSTPPVEFIAPDGKKQIIGENGKYYYDGFEYTLKYDLSGYPFGLSADGKTSHKWEGITEGTTPILSSERGFSLTPPAPSHDMNERLEPTYSATSATLNLPVKQEQVKGTDKWVVKMGNRELAMNDQIFEPSKGDWLKLITESGKWVFKGRYDKKIGSYTETYEVKDVKEARSFTYPRYYHYSDGEEYSYVYGDSIIYYKGTPFTLGLNPNGNLYLKHPTNNELNVPLPIENGVPVIRGEDFLKINPKPGDVVVADGYYEFARDTQGVWRSKELPLVTYKDKDIEAGLANKNMKPKEIKAEPAKKAPVATPVAVAPAASAIPTTSPTTETLPSNTPNQLEELTDNLRAIGYPESELERILDKDANAIKRAQNFLGVEADGFVGERTIGASGKLFDLEETRQDEDATKLQAKLILDSSGEDIIGVYNPKSRIAIGTIQKDGATKIEVFQGDYEGVIAALQGKKPVEAAQPAPPVPSPSVPPQTVEEWKKLVDKKKPWDETTLKQNLGDYYVDNEGYIWATDVFGTFIVGKADQTLLSEYRESTVQVDSEGKIRVYTTIAAPAAPSPAAPSPKPPTSTAPTVTMPSPDLTPQVKQNIASLLNVYIEDSAIKAGRQTPNEEDYKKGVGAYLSSIEGRTETVMLDEIKKFLKDEYKTYQKEPRFVQKPAPVSEPPKKIVYIPEDYIEPDDQFLAQIEGKDAIPVGTSGDNGIYRAGGEDYLVMPDGTYVKLLYDEFSGIQFRPDTGDEVKITYISDFEILPQMLPAPAAPPIALTPAQRALPSLVPAPPPLEGLTIDPKTIKVNPAIVPGAPFIPVGETKGKLPVSITGQQPVHSNFVQLQDKTVNSVKVYQSQDPSFFFVYQYKVKDGKEELSQSFTLHKSQYDGINFAGWDGNLKVIPLTSGGFRKDTKCEANLCSFVDELSVKGKPAQQTKTDVTLGANAQELTKKVEEKTFDPKGEIIKETFSDSISGVKSTIIAGPDKQSITYEKDGKKLEVAPEAYLAIKSDQDDKRALLFFGEAANSGLTKIDKIQSTPDGFSYVGNLKGIHILLLDDQRIATKEGNNLIGFIDRSKGLSVTTIEGKSTLVGGGRGYILSDGATAFVKQVDFDGTVISNRVDQQTAEAFIRGEYKDPKQAVIIVTKKDGASTEYKISTEAISNPNDIAFGMLPITMPDGSTAYVNPGIGFGLPFGLGGGELYRIENGKLARADTAELVALKNNLNKERQNRGIATFEQVSSQKFFANVERVFTEFQGLGFYATLFFDEDSLLKWRDNVDRAFATAYLGTEYWSSAICGNYLDGEDEGIAYAETPQGFAQVAAHIEATRSEPIETPEGREFIYKITFNVRNGDFDKDPRAPEKMKFNVVLKGERTANVFRQEQEVKRGSSFGRTGRNAIVQDSRAFFNEICMTFDETPLRWKVDDNKICNTIQESSSAATTVSVPASSAASTGASAQGDINDF